MTLRRWLVPAILAGAAFYAVQGGEYSTVNYYQLKRQVRQEQERSRRLVGTIDSLRAELTAIRTDPREQERVARETYGMIRPGERLYRLTTPAP